jgi:RNA polymerase sigma-70 factor, ECF subfamily
MSSASQAHKENAQTDSPLTAPLGPLGDGELAARIVAGDAAALEHVYARESGRVYRYALAMSHNATLAADVMQEVFVQFATKPQGFDASRGPLQAYLVGIARHQVLAAWVHEGRHSSLDVMNEDGEQEIKTSLTEEATEWAEPGQQLVARQTHEELMRAIAQLPAPFREALVLVELQERPYAEAAAIAGIELNTLRTRLHRAKAKLAKLLGAQAVNE